MRTAKLNDVDVLKHMSKDRPRTSAGIARRMGLEVFQITARLKSMEQRGLVVRKEGLWLKNYSWKRLEREVAARATQAQLTKSQRPLTNKMRDRDVPHTQDTQFWTMRVVRLSENRTIDVYIDTQGREWTRARDSEEAVLIRDFPDIPGLPPVRLIRFDKRNPDFQAAKQYYDAVRRELLGNG